MGDQLTDDCFWYYIITTGNIIVFGVLSGCLLGVLLTRAITRDEKSTPMLELRISGRANAYPLSSAIVYIIVVLVALTVIPTITLCSQAHWKATACAVYIIANAYALMRLFYFT